MVTGGMVTRPVSGQVEVSADLWLNESGSFSTDTSGANSTPTTASIQAGWLGKGEDNWLNASWAATVAAVGTPVPPVAATHGVDVTDGTASSPAGQTTITITPNSDYCPTSGTPHPLEVTLTATPGTIAVHPPVATAGPLAASLKTTITVVCPSAAANMGTELVPENPFPTDK
jgi:hypothetical protein